MDLFLKKQFIKLTYIFYSVQKISLTAKHISKMLWRKNRNHDLFHVSYVIIIIIQLSRESAEIIEKTFSIFPIHFSERKEKKRYLSLNISISLGTRERFFPGNAWKANSPQVPHFPPLDLRNRIMASPIWLRGPLQKISHTVDYFAHGDCFRWPQVLLRVFFLFQEIFFSFLFWLSLFAVPCGCFTGWIETQSLSFIRS